MSIFATFKIKEKLYDMCHKSFTIGKDQSCGLIISNSTISQEHCVIFIAEEGIEIKDLNSNYGTYVNNRRISSKKLKPNDIIVLGQDILHAISVVAIYYEEDEINSDEDEEDYGLEISPPGINDSAIKKEYYIIKESNNLLNLKDIIPNTISELTLENKFIEEAEKGAKLLKEICKMNGGLIYNWGNKEFNRFLDLIPKNEKISFGNIVCINCSGKNAQGKSLLRVFNNFNLLLLHYKNFHKGNFAGLSCILGFNRKNWIKIKADKYKAFFIKKTNLYSQEDIK